MSLEDARASLSHLSRRLTYLRERGEPEGNLNFIRGDIEALRSRVNRTPASGEPIADARPWDRLLGTMPDREVARRAGTTCNAVWRRRTHLGIHPYGVIRWNLWDHLLGTGSDRAISEAIGCCPETVYRRRQRLNIPPYRKHS